MATKKTNTSKKATSKKELPKTIVKNKKWLYGGIAFLIVIILIIVIAVVNNSNKDNNKDKENAQMEMKKNIVITPYFLRNGQNLLYITNNNSIDTSITGEIIFYDKNKKELQKESFSVFKLHKNYSAIEAIYLEISDWNSYEINYTVSSTSFYDELDYKKINVDFDMKNNALEVFNDSELYIKSIRLDLLFYQGEELVGTEWDYVTEIGPNKSKKDSYIVAYDYNSHEHIKYNQVKYLINTVYIVNE
jgi:hypothetical protein